MQGPFGEWLVDHGIFMNALGGVTTFPVTSAIRRMIAQNAPRVQQNIDRLIVAQKDAPPSAKEQLKQLQDKYARLKHHYDEILKCLKGEHDDPRNPCLNPKEYADAMKQLRDHLEKLVQEQSSKGQEKINALVSEIQGLTGELDRPVEGISNDDILDREARLRDLHSDLRSIRDHAFKDEAQQGERSAEELQRPGIDSIAWLGEPWAFGVGQGDSRWSLLDDIWNMDDTVAKIEQLLEKARKCKATPSGGRPKPCSEEDALRADAENAERNAWRTLQEASLINALQNILNNENAQLDALRLSTGGLFDLASQTLHGLNTRANFEAAYAGLLGQITDETSTGHLTNQQRLELAIELDRIRQAMNAYQDAQQRLKDCQQRNARGN